MASDTRMVVDPRGDLLASARECEAEVFLRWYGNTRAQLDDEYGPYEDRSVFVVLADDDDRVVAAVRLLAPGGAHGLKTLADVGKDPWHVDGARSASAVGIDLSTTWEVATLGVRPGTKAPGDIPGARLSLALYHGLILVSQANRMSSFVAILDERVRRMLASVGILTRPLPGASTAPYLGSAASTPVYAHCTPLLENQRKQFPEAYRLVALGVGLDGVAVPPFEDFRVGRCTDDTGPVGVVPVGVVPVGAVPVGAVPVSAVPVSAVPVSAVPVSAVPVSVERAGAGARRGR